MENFSPRSDKLIQRGTKEGMTGRRREGRKDEDWRRKEGGQEEEGRRGNGVMNPLEQWSDLSGEIFKYLWKQETIIEQFLEILTPQRQILEKRNSTNFSKGLWSHVSDIGLIKC